MRKIIIAIALVVLFNIIVYAEAREQITADLVGKMRISGKGEKAQMTMEMKGRMYISGKKLRQEITITTNLPGNRTDENPSFKSITIVDGDKRVLYSLMPAQKLGYKMTLPDKESQLQSGMWVSKEDIESALKKMGGTFLGTKKRGEYTIRGYRFKLKQTEGTPATTGEVWFVKDLNFPVIIRMNVSGMDMVIEFSNIKIGVPVDQKLFKVPSDYKMVESEGGPPGMGLRKGGPK